MNFGQWLNSLTWIDHIVILFIFSMGGWLAHLTMKGFRNIVDKTQNSPYSEEFRSSPFIIFVIAVPYTILIYKLIGNYISEVLKSTF